MNIYNIETKYRIKDFMENWNMSVHLWLKNYIFLRVVKKDKRDSLRPIMTTFLVSAIWHGFYPGYFVFFVSTALLDYVYKQAAKTYILFTWIPDIVLKVIG